MQCALALAKRAGESGEVPVGAVVVSPDDAGGKIIGRGYNRPIGDCDPSAHAEIVALRAAGRAVGNYRLVSAWLYVTLEPCAMCAAAIAHARIARLIFGSHDEKSGAAGGAFNLFDAPFINHRCAVTGGVLSAQCGAMLTEFFADKRNTR